MLKMIDTAKLKEIERHIREGHTPQKDDYREVLRALREGRLNAAPKPKPPPKRRKKKISKETDTARDGRAQRGHPKETMKK